ncbi:MAG: polyhydroxyalkanoic acid system family protein [Deltaproteobacteria bacterium]|nr:polyhydroxyalkanoic acid system family protein [Deltaproteobacteria bacterium]
MADIVLSRSHSFPLDVAKAKMTKMVESFKSKNPGFVDDVTWSADGCSASATGKMFDSRFKVNDTTFGVEVDLKGFAAKMAKGMAQTRLEKTVNEEFPA